MNIINDSKISANERSAELYIDAVEQAVAKRNLKEEFNPTECTITNDSVTCDGYSDPLIVEVNGEKPTSGTIVFKNGNVNAGTILIFNGYTVTINENGRIVLGDAGETNIPEIICTAVTTATTGNVPAGNYEPGDEYTCEVKKGTSYKFFVLSTESDKVNLIMYANINSDGQPVDSDNIENKGTVEWINKADFNDDEKWSALDDANNSYCNTKGAITAMKYLSAATQSWREELELNEVYDDENNRFVNFVITGKARLPKESEISSNQKWLTDYLSSGSLQEGQTNINAHNGYWTLSSAGDQSGSMDADGVYYFGIGSSSVYSSDYFGVRPVITVSKTQIS